MKGWLTFGCKHLTFSDLVLPDRWSHLLYCSSAPARTHTPSPFLFSLHLPFEFSPQPSKWISALLITYVYKTNIKQRKTTIKPQAFFFYSHAAINTKDFCCLKRCEDPSLPESKPLCSRTGVSSAAFRLDWGFGDPNFSHCRPRHTSGAMELLVNQLQIKAP